MSYIHRIGCLSPRVSRQVVCHVQTRALSSIVLQRTRPTFARPEPLTLAHASRNYWWSPSPKPPAAQETETPEQFAPSQAEPDAPPPPVVEEAPVETASVAETAGSATTETPSIEGIELSGVPAEASVPDASAIPDVVSSLPSPLHYGDLAALGLAGWTPAGFCRWGIEILQVSTGLPWFWTIIGATVISRVILFPFQVSSMRATAKLAPFQDDLAALRQRMQAAQASKDMLTMQSAMMKQRVLYEKADVNMATMAIAPLIQLPVTLGMFFGVKKMCDLPVEQLKWSGLSFLPDLTVADPTCTLPIISAVMMNVQLSLAMRDMVAAPHMAHVMNLFRVMSVVSIPLMWNLPSGVMVYVITSIVSIAAQTVLLRQPAVRSALNIPILSKQFEGKPATFRESIAYAKKWWGDKKAEQEALIRAKKRGN